MTETPPSCMKLSAALRAIPGVPQGMIDRAESAYYHDFLSPLAMPEIQLVADLRALASAPATPRNSRPLLRALVQDVIDGKHDATREESDAWARSPEGRETIGELPPRMRAALGFPNPEETADG